MTREDPDLMTNKELADEVMTLRAQVRVLQLWNKKAKERLTEAVRSYKALNCKILADYMEEIL